MNVIVPYSHTEYSTGLSWVPRTQIWERTFSGSSRVITLIRHRDWEYPFSAVLRTDDRCAPVAPGDSTASAPNNPKQRTRLVPRLHGRVTSQPDEGRGHQSLRGRNED